MSEDSTTPDLVELARWGIESLNRGDLDAAFSTHSPDLVWDASIQGIGVFESAAVFQSFARDWLSSYDEIVMEPEWAK